jgi:hypothetical protein
LWLTQDVRWEAAKALARVSEWKDVPELRELLKDPDERLGQTAAEALVRVGGNSPLLALTLPYEDTSLLHWYRWLARYWGGKAPQDSEVLCAYLGRPKDEPRPPISMLNGSNPNAKSRRENALNDLRLLRDEAWRKTESSWLTEPRWLKEDVAKWWAQIIILEVMDWTKDDVEKELKAIRDCLKDEKNKVGRTYIPAIEQVIAPFEIPLPPFVRTLLAFLAVNLVAVLLYWSSPWVGLKAWLPFVVALVGGAGISLPDIGAWATRLHTIPWLLAVLLLVEFATLVGGGFASPGLLRQIAPVKPFNLIVPVALRLPCGKRRHFAEYVRGVREQVKRDRHQAAHEEYLILPADVVDDRNAPATLNADPAGAVLTFLTAGDDSSGRVLVEATGGTGKSALIREVVTRALAAFEKAPTHQPLPILLTGGGDDIEKMVKDALGATLILPESLPQHLDAGDFFLVIDRVSESGLADKVLAAFLNSAHAKTTPVLLGSRPTSEFRSIVEGTPPWMTVEPRRLDEVSLDLFVGHYRGKPLPDPVKAACRGAEGTYLPILVRMAMRVNADRGTTVSVADIYRDYFLKLFENQFPGDAGEAARFQRLEEASRYCLETYWSDGRRNCEYRPNDSHHGELQQSLKKAGVLVPVGGITVAKEVKFFHDSMQSYLTAMGLSDEDKAGYGNLRRSAEEGDGPWDRRRVLFRAAGDPRFAGAHSDIVLTGSSELFQMILATFSNKAALRQVLRTELQAWANAQHQNLRLLDFKAALPKDVAGKAKSFADNKELVTEAVEVAFKTDEHSGTVESLGALYGCLTPLIWRLQQAERKT